MTNFVRKVAQISALFLVYFEKHHFLIKTVVATFWHLFEEFGLLFIPTSGHTAGDDDEFFKFFVRLLARGLFLENQTINSGPRGPKNDFLGSKCL